MFNSNAFTWCKDCRFNIHLANRFYSLWWRIHYALLFGDVDVDAPEYESLKKFIKNGFTPMPNDGRKFVPVNAFIGLYLRISVLLKLGYYRILIDDTESFFGGMVEKTGTLWEYRQMKGSFDHGFASFVLPAIYEAKKHIES